MLNTGVRKYFNDELEAKPLVPDLKTILNNLKDIDNVDLIMKSSIDELILQLGSLIGPGGLPNNTKYENSMEKQTRCKSNLSLQILETNKLSNGLKNNY